MSDPSNGTIAADGVIAEDWVAEDDFDYDNYENSIGNRFKQGWIVFQACMMTTYMTIGLCAYSKLQKGWSKVKSLFVFQTVIIAYLVVNEFTHRHIQGVFIILLFTQYSMFITFCLVVDSMVPPSTELNEKYNKMRMFRKFFRLCIHVTTLGLFISTFFMKSCDAEIYPINFVAVTILIVAQQIYDLWLACNNYQIDYANLPFISQNKLRYNKELFEKQSKCLLIANMFFGALSICTVAAGYLIINRQFKEGINQHLLCINGNEWVYMSLLGNIFGTMLQLLILMQINITQYVLVRVPRNLGLFDTSKVDLKHQMSMGLRDRLLDTAVNSEGVETAPTPKMTFTADNGEKLSLGQLLQRIKDSRQNHDDNFRL